MAEIVLGIGAAHGPLLSTPPEQWDLRAKADRENKKHWFRGKTYDFESLLAERAPGFAAEVELSVRQERYARCRKAIADLRAIFHEAAPDALVIVGNDQREFFDDDLTPAITIYNGAVIENVQHLHESSPGLNIAEVGNAPEAGTTYAGAPELANHLMLSLQDQGFDLAQSSRTTVGGKRHGIPHAYGFLYHTLLEGNPPPSVPVILNVHFPFNQPKTRRCLELGGALRNAIRGFDGYERVAILASGGLSHFVVDEELDRRVLNAMEHGDEESLATIPESYFKVGTAEIKNWYPLISAMNAEGKKYHCLDYVPCYRSEAGTGCAMAFVYWR